MGHNPGGGQRIVAQTSTVPDVLLIAYSMCSILKAILI